MKLVNEDISKAVLDHVRHHVWTGISNRFVGSIPWIRVQDNVGRRVRSRVSNRVLDRVWDRVWRRVWDTVRSIDETR